MTNDEFNNLKKYLEKYKIKSTAVNYRDIVMNSGKAFCYIRPKTFKKNGINGIINDIYCNLLYNTNIRTLDIEDDWYARPIITNSALSYTETISTSVDSIKLITSHGLLDVDHLILTKESCINYLDASINKDNMSKNYTVVPIATNSFPFELNRIPIYNYCIENELLLKTTYAVSIFDQEILCYLYPEKLNNEVSDYEASDVINVLSTKYKRSAVYNDASKIEYLTTSNGNTLYIKNLPVLTMSDTLTQTKIKNIANNYSGYFLFKTTVVASIELNDLFKDNFNITYYDSSISDINNSTIYTQNYFNIDIPECTQDVSSNDISNLTFDSEYYYNEKGNIKLRVHSVNGLYLYDKKLYAYAVYDKNLARYYITTSLSNSDFYKYISGILDSDFSSDSDFFKYIIVNHKIKLNSEGESDYPNIDSAALEACSKLIHLPGDKKYSDVNSIELFGGVGGFPVYYKSGKRTAGVALKPLIDILKISFITHVDTLNILVKSRNAQPGFRDESGDVFVDTNVVVNDRREWRKSLNAEKLVNVSDQSMCSYSNSEYMPIPEIGNVYARMQLNNVIFIIEDVAEMDMNLFPVDGNKPIVTNPVNDEILSDSVDDDDYYIGAGTAQNGFSDGSEAVLGDSDLQSFDLFYYRAPNEDTGDVSVKSLKSIIGLPLQFMSHVDSAVTGYGYGKEFTSNIIYDSSICVIKPGTPTGDSGFISTILSDGLFQGFLNLTSVIGDTANILFGNGNVSSEEFVKSFINKIFVSDVSRLYVWKSDLEHYIEYVNTLCHMFISYLGIGELNYKDPGTNEDIPYNQYNFLYNLDIFDAARQTKTGKYDTMEIQTDSLYTDQNERRSLSNIFGDDPAVYLYYSADSDIQESFSTSTTASEIMGAGQGLSDISKQITYLTGSTFLGAFDDSIGSAISTAVEGTGLKETPLGRLFGNIAEGVGVIIGGNNFDVPEMWSDSDRQISHSLTVKLISPYGDPESIFLYVLQPLAQILAFSLPRQFSVNSYTSPFIIQAFSKGQFNIQFGIVDSLTITRGGNGKESHTIHNIPTELDVTISIKDMYEKVALSNEYLIDDGFFNKVTGGILDLGFRKAATLIFNNIGLLDFCASYCGYNLNTPQGEHISAYLWNMYLNRIRNNIDWGELWNNLKEDGVWGLLNSKNFPGLTKKHIDIYNNTIHKLTTFSTT